MSYPLPSNYDSQFNEPDEYEWLPGLGGYEPKDDRRDEQRELDDSVEAL